MLNLKVFNKCMSVLLITHDILIDNEKNKVFYDLMKEEFSDDEFEFICNKICREENLYNKYPTPPMFYSRKKDYQDNDDFLLKSSDKQFQDWLNGDNDV